MRSSTDHILTSHAGSLPRPDDLIAANQAREAGQATDEGEFQRKLRASVGEMVPRQRDLGRGSSAMRPTSSSTPSSSPSASFGSRTWSAGIGSSLQRIAGLAAASIRKSPGPSSKHWQPAPHSPPASSGADQV